MLCSCNVISNPICVCNYRRLGDTHLIESASNVWAVERRWDWDVGHVKLVCSQKYHQEFCVLSLNRLTKIICE